MAVVILVPLVLIDLLVAQVLVLVGLNNQPTALITIPLKLVLFLGIGGWDVVIGGLVEGYA
jgi:flagellar biosynthesis protein FliP